MTLQVQQPMLQVQPMDMQVQNIIASQGGQLILQGMLLYYFPANQKWGWDTAVDGFRPKKKKKNLLRFLFSTTSICRLLRSQFSQFSQVVLIENANIYAHNVVLIILASTVVIIASVVYFRVYMQVLLFYNSYKKENFLDIHLLHFYNFLLSTTCRLYPPPPRQNIPPQALFSQ